MKKIVLACLLAVATSAAMAEVTVSQPWIRATVAQQPTAGVYMQLHSTGDARLVSAASPVADRVEIHQMSMQDNIMRMRQIEGLDLPAGKTVTLKPGAYHLMMIGLKQTLKAGDHVPMTLMVEQGGKQHTLALDVPVHALGESMHSAPGNGRGAMKMDMPSH